MYVHCQIYPAERDGGSMKIGRPRKNWHNNITKCTGKNMEEAGQAMVLEKNSDILAESATVFLQPANG